MPPSYQKGAAGVNAPAKDPPVPSPREQVHAGREQARPTATFVPYFWEAYNEIVEPRRFDHYLVTRWLPELGPTGFAIVKALRDRCYHNPRTGILRDSYEADMEELAQAVGISRATLFREFGRNEALGHFVQRVEQYQMAGGRPKQTSNLFRVSMDDPIHASDLERYEDLRALKEMERDTPPPKKIVKPEAPVSPSPPYESHSETHRKNAPSASSRYESQIETHSPSYESQFATPNTQSQIETPNTPSQFATAIKEDLPSDSLTKESLTPGAGGQPPHISPQGGTDPDHPEDDGGPLHAAWQEALPTLSPLMSAPAFHTHVARLRPIHLTELADGAGVEIALAAPSAFTREWVEKRHVPAIEEALGSVLGCPVTVRLTQSPKEDHDA